MSFAEDRSIFLADFGEDATFTPTTGSADTVKVIHDRAYIELMGIAATNPIGIGDAADFPESTTVDGTLVINGTTYTIREREPMDDGAFVRLQLVT